jgi:hypothetical protein
MVELRLIGKIKKNTEKLFQQHSSTMDLTRSQWDPNPRFCDEKAEPCRPIYVTGLCYYYTIILGAG